MLQTPCICGNFSDTCPGRANLAELGRREYRVTVVSYAAHLTAELSCLDVKIKGAYEIAKFSLCVSSFRACAMRLNIIYFIIVILPLEANPTLDFVFVYRQ